MMGKDLRVGAAALLAFVVSGCATVTRGTHEQFVILSQPSGAAVSMTTGMTCTTPCKMKLRRKEEFVATITKPGFKPAQVNVTSKVHGGGGTAMAGNLLAGGLIGGILDGTNGSMRDLKPNPIDVTLVAEDAPGPVVTPAAAPPPEPAAPVAAPVASAKPVL